MVDKMIIRTLGINMLSILIAVTMVLILAGYNIVLILHPLLLGFVVVCTIVSLLLGRVLKGNYGNSLSIFLSILAVAFIWSGFSANVILFPLLAIPASLSSLVLYKVLYIKRKTAETTLLDRDLHLTGEIYNGYRKCGYWREYRGYCNKGSTADGA